MEFKDFKLKEESLKTLQEIGFDKPTLAQENFIPLALKKTNICGRSPTGSGKTHAFLLPLLEHVDSSINKVQGLILTPTRELAKQTYKMCVPFIKNYPGLKVLLLSSGDDRERAIKDAQKKPQIIIGTPGRIKDLAFDSAVFNITTASMCILDEADMILESGFMDEVGMIIESLKSNTQFMCFSASLPEKLIQFLKKYIKNMDYVNLAPNSTITASEVNHIAYPTHNRDRITVLKKLLSSINPYLALVFASRKENVTKIYHELAGEFNTTIIHGDLSSTNRKTTMKQIQEGRYSIVVCSDIAARGIDIEGVSHVINYDLPYEEDFYFHRAGRTGRNGSSGICYTLYDKEELPKLLHLNKRGVKFGHGEFINGTWTELKPLIKPKNHKPHPVNDEIRKVVNQHAKKKVKPNHKKILKMEIQRIKQKHRREIIKKDIERQKIERYKKESMNKHV